MIECICLHLMKFIYSYKRNGYSLWMNMCVRLQMTIHSLNKVIRLRMKITCGFICGDAIFWLKISGWTDIKWKRKQCQMKRRWWIFFFTLFHQLTILKSDFNIKSNAHKNHATICLNLLSHRIESKGFIHKRDIEPGSTLHCCWNKSRY